MADAARRVLTGLSSPGSYFGPEIVMNLSPAYSLKLPSERRHDDRPLAAIDGQAVEIGKSRLPVVIKGLSRQGAMVDVDHTWKTGAQIWLFFPSGLAVNARVVWAQGHQHGCLFLQRLTEAELQLAQARR
jgi:hypothetical protein